MNRRDFLKYCSVIGASVALGETSAYADWLTNKKRNGFPQGMLLIDAHAHPDEFPNDKSSTLDKINKIGMHGSGFGTIGDSISSNGNPIYYTFGQVLDRLQRVRDLEAQGLLKIVRRHEDIPRGGPPKNYILGTNENTVFEDLDTLYGLGVRMITLMHYLDNQFGRAMRRNRGKDNGDGLSELGINAIQQMMDLGIIVDVAHAHFYTLEDIVDIAKSNQIPVIDSHTSLSPCPELCGGRLRILEEMEMIADTGGLVCTWPLKWESPKYNSSRETIFDWAQENFEIAQRIGFEHIALGTDGGGLLPEMVDNYESILDLPKLVIAMHRVGFKRSEIEAYMGGNLLRVIKKCIG